MEILFNGKEFNDVLDEMADIAVHHTSCPVCGNTKCKYDVDAFIGDNSYSKLRGILLTDIISNEHSLNHEYYNDLCFTFRCYDCDTSWKADVLPDHILKNPYVINSLLSQGSHWLTQEIENHIYYTLQKEHKVNKRFTKFCKSLFLRH